MTTNIAFNFTDEVTLAKKQNKPLVALESSIISQGMPYPVNLETANQCEQQIRDCGAAPATIAIREGRILVGLEKADLEFFATSKKVSKASRRDISHVIATKQSASTTVAATMLIAARAQIQIFATGGIGGVHLGGEHSMDISADLHELAISNVVVVCAGAKSILDIGLTLEKLESNGVPVIGYQSDEFPSFYSRKSGYRTPLVCHTIAELAETIAAHQSLQLGGGIVIANPIAEQDELPFDEMKKIIKQADADRLRLNIYGKEITPFLLQRIAELTEGKSLTANRSLVLNNAKLAGELAAYQK